MVAKVSRWSVITWIAPMSSQHAGGAEKAADHGVRHETDRAAKRGGEPGERHEQHAGRGGAERHYDQRRLEQMARCLRPQAASSVRPPAWRPTAEAEVKSGPSDGERQRAAPRHHRGRNGGGQERHRNAVGQPPRQRTREDERRIGQTTGRSTAALQIVPARARREDRRDSRWLAPRTRSMATADRHLNPPHPPEIGVSSRLLAQPDDRTTTVA